MTLYREVSGQFTIWVGEQIDGVSHPLNVENIWSKPELAVVGLYSPDPADAIPAGKVSSKVEVKRVNGTGL
mgnify:CR=1 FL=1